MSHALDTNLLVRTLHQNHPMQPVAAQAVERLLDQGVALHVFPQNLYEFWVVATRPVDQNGLGMDATRTLRELARLKSALPLLPDIPEIYSEWERLVNQHAVSGRKAHDTRIVAAMKVYGLHHLVTFNVDDFKRYAGITVVHPQDIVAPAPGGDPEIS
jgi:predicted nucleic acid-binding protein